MAVPCILVRTCMGNPLVLFLELGEGKAVFEKTNCHFHRPRRGRVSTDSGTEYESIFEGVACKP